MLAIMTAMGLYERNFWGGRSDMLLRIGVSFLVGLFMMTLTYYCFLTCPWGAVNSVWRLALPSSAY